MVDTLAIILLAVYCACAFVLFIYGINCYVMVYLCSRGRKRQRDLDREMLDEFWKTHSDADLPVVTTQLPIFNEANVVERLVRSVAAIDYPIDRHEIQILDDSTDHTLQMSEALAAELREKGYDVKVIRRPDRKGFKAGALGYGLDIARGDFVAVFDADFVPGPEFLRSTVPYLLMESGLGFVQARWGHRNRNYSLLTVAQSMGIDGHFAVEQSARSWSGLFLNFNGTAGVWRKETIYSAGGWKSDTLTEDLDLSYRAQLAGWEPRYLVDVVAPAEVPTDINALKTQQHRWAKGSIQTAMRLLPEVLRRKDVGFFKKLQAWMHLTHYMIHPVMLAMALLVLPLLFLGDHWVRTPLMVGLLVSMLVSMMAPNFLYLFAQRLTRDDWKKSFKYLPTLMVLGVGLAVNNTRAVLEALFGRKSEFIRTPKLGAGAEKSLIAAVVEPTAKAAIRWYREPLNRLYLLEIFVGMWSLAAFIKYLTLTKFIIGPLLLINAIGYTSVGILSLVHEIRTRRANA